MATFLDIPLRQLFGTRWYPIENQFRLLPLVVGTLLVTLGACSIIAVPLGWVAAIYRAVRSHRPGCGISSSR